MVGWQHNGPVVDYPGNQHGPLVARTVVPLGKAAVLGAVDDQREVLLTFDEERSDRPIIVGLLHTVADAEAEARSAPNDASAGDAEANADDALDGAGVGDTDAKLDNLALGDESIEAQVDGRRIVLEGRDEIVLRCGKSSITLRRNGRVVVRGTFIDSRSQGVHRIRGGAVKIN